MPYLVLIEQEMHRKLLPKRGRSAGNLVIKFDLTEMLRGDFASTMQAAALGRNWRILTGNEARELFGYDPIEGEDTLIQPVNMAQVDENGVPHAVSGSIDLPDTAQDKQVGQEDTNPDEQGNNPDSEETPNENGL